MWHTLNKVRLPNWGFFRFPHKLSTHPLHGWQSSIVFMACHAAYRTRAAVNTHGACFHSKQTHVPCLRTNIATRLQKTKRGKMIEWIPFNASFTFRFRGFTIIKSVESSGCTAFLMHTWGTRHEVSITKRNSDGIRFSSSSLYDCSLLILKFSLNHTNMIIIWTLAFTFHSVGYIFVLSKRAVIVKWITTVLHDRCFSFYLQDMIRQVTNETGKEGIETGNSCLINFGFKLHLRRIAPYTQKEGQNLES